MYIFSASSIVRLMVTLESSATINNDKLTVMTPSQSFSVTHHPFSLFLSQGRAGKH
jgi:hypothetical protein